MCTINEYPGGRDNEKNLTFMNAHQIDVKGADSLSSCVLKYSWAHPRPYLGTTVNQTRWVHVHKLLCAIVIERDIFISSQTIRGTYIICRYTYVPCCVHVHAQFSNSESNQGVAQYIIMFNYNTQCSYIIMYSVLQLLTLYWSNWTGHCHLSCEVVCFRVIGISEIWVPDKREFLEHIAILEESVRFTSSLHFFFKGSFVVCFSSFSIPQGSV